MAKMIAFDQEARDADEREEARRSCVPPDRDHHRDGDADGPEDRDLPPRAHSGNEREAVREHRDEERTRHEAFVREEGGNVRHELPEPVEQLDAIDDAEERDRREVCPPDPELSESTQPRSLPFLLHSLPLRAGNCARRMPYRTKGAPFRGLPCARLSASRPRAASSLGWRASNEADRHRSP